MRIHATSLLVLSLAACARGAQTSGPSTTYVPAEPGERHLTNIRQLTVGGNNAEAYLSASGKQLIFHRQNEVGAGCDQQYVMNIDTKYENARVDGRLHALGVGAQLASWTHLELYGGLRDETRADITVREGTLTWFGLDWNVSLGPRWMFLAMVERSSGQEEGTTQFHGMLSYRF